MSKKIILDKLPVLPLRDIVIYPGMMVPLFIGRETSLAALDYAIQHDKKILLVAQKKAETETPAGNELYTVGTVGTILQWLSLPDNSIKVLVEGDQRVNVSHFEYTDTGIFAEVSVMPEYGQQDVNMEKHSKTLLALFGQFLRYDKKFPPEILNSLSNLSDIGRLADAVAVHLSLTLAQRQRVLEMANVLERVKFLIAMLEDELNSLKMEAHVVGETKKQMEKSQRDYYLNEQMKVIKKELGETDELNDMEALTKKIKKSGMSAEAKHKAEAELRKLKLMPPMSAEATVSRNYLDALLAVPWKKCTKICRDLKRAEKILNEEHDGLEKVKERILEYLAVQNRVKTLKGPILCLVGPPGVGKTSLGRSIAKSTGREFVRMSLGGVRDEAEIRGHRRTYIGSLPGKVIHNLSKVKVKNPLFLLDEIDKMASDFRGDPAAALLEVLDPEQNHTFNDHYLEVDYDLSEVMFVTTANTQDIPPALADRMEIIELSGYTEDEKVAIAQNHLISKEFEANGVKQTELEITEEAIRDIIRYYTREAGVRNLQREIAKICRKVVKEILLQSKLARRKKIIIRARDVEKYLGVRRCRFGVAEQQDQVGQVSGLAWTEFGGELLTVEAAIMPGAGKVSTTGQLGEVMQESIQAAITVVRTRSERFGISPDFFEKHDVHIHVPEGAIPKDGPSAGITMAMAVISAIMKIPVFANVAMTGEITLRGEVLPIGGLKEKLLAARRGNIQNVIIPEENCKDLKEIADNVKANLNIHPVRWIDQVWQLALHEIPEMGNVSTVNAVVAARSKKSSAKKPPIEQH